MSNQCVPDGDSCGEERGACGNGACESCGAPEQACCDGSCQSGLGCMGGFLGAGSTCQACGGDGEPCCADRACDGGACVGGGFGGFGGGLGASGTCQMDCGAPGQECCQSAGGFGGGSFGSCEQGASCAGDGMCEVDESGSDDEGSGGEEVAITVRARGTTGGEHINLRVGGDVIADWDLTTDYEDYTQTTDASGGITVEFDNDQGGADDVQIDYISVDGMVRQAEDRPINTGAYETECGDGAFTGG